MSEFSDNLPQFLQVALSPHYIYSTHIPCSTRLAPVAAGLCRLIPFVHDMSQAS